MMCNLFYKMMFYEMMFYEMMLILTGHKYLLITGH